MADTRRDKRAPVSLKVRFKSATVDEFIEQYSSDISRGGIFIKSKSPMAVGTLLKFEFQLKDESRLIHGVGRVVWKREGGDADAEHPPGMGIKFIKMDPESRGLVESIAGQRGDQEGQFEAGKDPRKRPPRKPTEPFFPAAPSPADLPPPEDSTQVRHASEFLASALSGGADEAAAAEAKAKAEEARRRTEEIQKQREAEAARRKASVDDAEREGRELAERARAEAAAKVEAAKAASLGEFASTTSQLEEDVDLDAMLDEAVADATATDDVIADRAAAETASAASAETVAKVEAAEKKPVVVATPPKEARESRPSVEPEEKKGMGLPIGIGVAALLAVGGYYVYTTQIAPGDVAETPPLGAEPPEPVVEEPEPEVPDEEVAAPDTEPGPDPDSPTTPIQINATPAGGTVLVDGREAGTAPGPVDLPIGELVSVTVRLAGYRESTQDVAAVEGGAALRFVLEPMEYVIDVTTTPPGARVVAQGRRTEGPGQLVLPSAPRGDVRVVATKPGFERAVQTVAADAFQERDGRMVHVLAMVLSERATSSTTAMMTSTSTTTAMVTAMDDTGETMEPAMTTMVAAMATEPPPTMEEPPPTMEEPPTMQPTMIEVPDNPF